MGANEAPWAESLISFSMALAWIWPAKRPHITDITHHVAIIAMVSMVAWSQSKFSRSTLEGKVWAQKMHSGGLVPLWVQKNNALMGCRKSALSRKFGRVSNQESSRFMEYSVQASVSWNHHWICPCNSIRPTQHRIFIEKSFPCL